MDDQTLEKVYQEGLEERIIDYLATTKQWSYEQVFLCGIITPKTAHTPIFAWK